MFKARKRTLLAAVAVAAAAAPSTASAMLIMADPVSGPPPTAQVAGASHPAQQIQSSSSPFAWDDAGIGAAAAIALMGAGTVALGGRRRHPARTG